jgi:hypothetical protein
VADDDVVAGDGDRDAKAVLLAVGRVPVGPLDGDAARADPRVERVELLGAPPHVSVDRVGVRDVPESNLNGE